MEKAIAIMALTTVIGIGFEVYLRREEKRMKASVENLAVWTDDLQERFTPWFISKNSVVVENMDYTESVSPNRRRGNKRG